MISRMVRRSAWLVQSNHLVTKGRPQRTAGLVVLPRTLDTLIECLQGANGLPSSKAGAYSLAVPVTGVTGRRPRDGCDGLIGGFRCGGKEQVNLRGET